MKTLLKKLRGSQPFNYLASSGLKAAVDLTGTQPDWFVKYMPKVGEVRSRLPNGRILRMWSSGDDLVTNLIFWKGWSGFEPGVADVLYQLALGSQVVFDVGAHVGFYSLLTASANPASKVHAFEPLGPVYDRLLANVKLNHLDNITCSRVAAGSQEGSADFFHVESDYLPSASSLSQEFLASQHELARSRVRVITLDAYVEANAIERVDLMKIDTETTEPDVLRGMLATLARDHPSIVCEVLGWYDTGQAGRLTELLEPLGYRYYVLTPQGPVCSPEIVLHETCWNYLFTTLDREVLSRITGYPC